VLSDEAVCNLYIDTEHLDIQLETAKALIEHGGRLTGSLGDLATLQREELARAVGVDAMEDVDRALGEYGLRLGLAVPGWRELPGMAMPPEMAALLDGTKLRDILRLVDPSHTHEWRTTPGRPGTEQEACVGDYAGANGCGLGRSRKIGAGPRAWVWQRLRADELPSRDGR